MVSSRFTHLRKSKIRNTNWLGLEADTSPNVTFAYLSTVNLYYGLFKDLMEGPCAPYLHGFSDLFYHGLYRQLLSDVIIQLTPLTQGSNLGNKADSNQEPASRDKIDLEVSDRANNKAADRVDAAKELNSRHSNGAHTEAENGANIGDWQALDAGDIEVGNGIHTTKKLLFQYGNTVRLGNGADL